MKARRCVLAIFTRSQYDEQRLKKREEAEEDMYSKTSHDPIFPSENIEEFENINSKIVRRNIDFINELS